MKELNKEQQIKLLRLARKAIYVYLKEKKSLEVDRDEFSEDIFSIKCGAFVTIHKAGMLRGCMGYIKGLESIPETIINTARSSAFEDPRFPNLTEEEFNSIDIEISILSPIEEIRSISSIVVGRDGLIISQGNRSGLLLPQVATENNWGLLTFLENTCYKAGLNKDAWKSSDTNIEKFSAQVFGEKELGL
ncbi:MAG: AmmeMemoRadiSam system protein A [Spirochaetota bacterium]|nr:AmmeMemoRadiSam system protein A [Spirochaetota bacterium]